MPLTGGEIESIEGYGRCVSELLINQRFEQHYQRHGFNACHAHQCSRAKGPTQYS